MVVFCHRTTIIAITHQNQTERINVLQSHFAYETNRLLILVSEKKHNYHLNNILAQ